MDALIKFPAEDWQKWPDHVGRKYVLDLANAEWNMINQGHGWVARIQHAIQQVVLAVHEVREHWNLVAAYKRHIGTLAMVPDVVFMPREPEKDKPEIWVKRLDHYRVAYMKLLSVNGRRWRFPTGEEASLRPRVGRRRGVLRS